MRSMLNIIKKFDLKVATKRPLPLFTLSCIAYTYVNLIKKKYFKCSYDVVAGWGDKNGFVSLMNEEGVALMMRKKLKGKKNIRTGYIKPLKNDFVRFKKNLTKFQSGLVSKDSLKNLKTLLKYYTTYLVIIGNLNCLWRYIGDNSKTKFSSRDIEYFARLRGLVAGVYPQMERILSLLCDDVGKTLGVEDSLLRYFTFNELNNFLNKIRPLSLKEITKLKKRKIGYFFVYTKDNLEIVIEDVKIIKEIKKTIFKEDQTGTEIKGTVVYPGLINAKVFNYEQGAKKMPSGKFILVTHMTHPKDLALIKKSVGIITDEGGVLCHAAIIARELKKPCIIGTKTATQLLKTNMSVELDANKGIVNIKNKK